MYNLNDLNFNSLLKNYRKSKKITLEQLGNKICKTKSTISKYENGEIIPDIITILEICNVLDINISKLFPYQPNSDFSSLNNPFNSNKLYLYYYSKKSLIPSIIDIYENSHITLYNGIKDNDKYKTKNFCSYDGFLEYDKTIGYMNLSRNPDNSLLEKIQISFTIPLHKNFNMTTVFILCLTPSYVPIVKKGILTTFQINDFSRYNDDLLINNNDLNKIKLNNSWILENSSYDSFFYENT